MVDIFGMTLEVISRPFMFKLLKLCHFDSLFFELVEMVITKGNQQGDRLNLNYLEMTFKFMRKEFIKFYL